MLCKINPIDTEKNHLYFSNDETLDESLRERLSDNLEHCRNHLKILYSKHPDTLGIIAMPYKPGK